MNVLYIHPAGAFGGASKSLIELFLAFKQQQVNGYVITPKGSVTKALSQAGMQVIETIGLSQFDNTRFGYYRKWRWLILLREIWFLPFSIAALIRAKHLPVEFDLIHVNEITLLPVAVIAKSIFHKPIIMHVRSLQRDNNGLLTKMFYKTLSKTVDTVICIDETVKATMPRDVDIVVIHNGINIDNIDLNNSKAAQPEIKVGLVGVLLRLKGVYEFVEAAKIVASESKVKTKFILVGENARRPSRVVAWFYKRLRFSEDIYSNIVEFIDQNNLSDQIELRGQVADITTFYPELDILCFPSHLNACGRPVFEAAFFEIPSIVAVSNPKSDTIIPGVTGITIEKPDARLLADAVILLTEDMVLRKKLGLQAKAFVNQHFDIKKNALIFLDQYARLVAK